MAFTTEMCICYLGKYLVQLRKPATQGVRFKSGSATRRDVHFAKKLSPTQSLFANRPSLLGAKRHALRPPHPGPSPCAAGSLPFVGYTIERSSVQPSRFLTTINSLCSVGCKMLFHSGHHNRHNLYDIKMSLLRYKNESFLCRLLQIDTKNCNLVSAAYVS
jgi:hypothetical protein